MTTKKLVAQKITALLGHERRWTTIARAWELAEQFKIAIRPTVDGWIASSTTSVAVVYHEDAAMAICVVVLRIHNVEIKEPGPCNSTEKATPTVRFENRTDLVRCATYACSNLTDPGKTGPDNQPICAECERATNNVIWALR
jgi:hypothetical protein